MTSRYFEREEFGCKCGCGFAAVDVELLRVLEDVRHYFNAPVIINSACRCISHNHSVGGKTHSRHLQGIAADIVVQGIEPIDIYTYLNLNYPKKYGIGNYTNFTHIDMRTNKTRWEGNQ